MQHRQLTLLLLLHVMHPSGSINKILPVLGPKENEYERNETTKTTHKEGQLTATTEELSVVSISQSPETMTFDPLIQMGFNSSSVSEMTATMTLVPTKKQKEEDVQAKVTEGTDVLAMLEKKYNEDRKANEEKQLEQKHILVTKSPSISYKSIESGTYENNILGSNAEHVQHNPPQLSHIKPPGLKSLSLVLINASAASPSYSAKSPTSPLQRNLTYPSISHTDTIYDSNNLNNNIDKTIPSRQNSHSNSIFSLTNIPSDSDTHESYSILDDFSSSSYLMNETVRVTKAPDSILNLTAELGGSAFLPCTTHHSMETQVSWVRRRDWHILTSGTLAYTKDERFGVHHAKGSTDWTLVIKYVQLDDAGTYECQVSIGSGILSRLVMLDVVVPKAVIPGSGEYHIDLGSSITLDCFIHHSLVAPQFVFWYHNSRMINYDRERGGISVDIDFGPEVRSRLTVSRATPADSGNYTCAATNTQPASTSVYILHSNKMAAIQPRGYSTASRFKGCQFLLGTFGILQLML